MVINRYELEKINEIVKKFPDVDIFTFKVESCGIGDMLCILIPLKLNDQDGVFKIQLSNVGDW